MGEIVSKVKEEGGDCAAVTSASTDENIRSLMKGTSSRRFHPLSRIQNKKTIKEETAEPWPLPVYAHPIRFGAN